MVPAIMGAFRRSTFGTWKMTSRTIQTQAVAKIVRRPYKNAYIIVEVFPVALIQSTIQLALLSFAVLWIKIP